MYLMMDREISCKGHCESFSRPCEINRIYGDKEISG